MSNIYKKLGLYSLTAKVVRVFKMSNMNKHIRCLQCLEIVTEKFLLLLCKGKRVTSQTDSISGYDSIPAEET